MREKKILSVPEIEIETEKILNSLFVGERKSFRKGSGLEFDEFDEYVPGQDDPKKIDWLASAKTNETFVREYYEERQLTIFLLMDFSQSMQYQDNWDMLTKICACIGFSSAKMKDKIGMIGFTDKMEFIVHPERGRDQALNLVGKMGRQVDGTNTELISSLLPLHDIEPSMVFWISDFPVLGLNNELRLKLASLSVHDIIPIIIENKFEDFIIGKQILNFQDAETGQAVSFANTKENKKRLKEELKRQAELRQDFFKNAGLEFIKMSEFDVGALVRFFAERRGRHA